MLGRSLPCSDADWVSPPVSPGQKPTEKQGKMICPGIGQCKKVLPWRPGKHCCYTNLNLKVSSKNKHIKFQLLDIS